MAMLTPKLGLGQPLVTVPIASFVSAKICVLCRAAGGAGVAGDIRIPTRRRDNGASLPPTFLGNCDKIILDPGKFRSVRRRLAVWEKSCKFETE